MVRIDMNNKCLIGKLYNLLVDICNYCVFDKCNKLSLYSVLNAIKEKCLLKLDFYYHFSFWRCVYE